MNIDTALVDEIVRRVMEQLPGAPESSRLDVPVVPASPAVASEVSGGRFLPPAPQLHSQVPAPPLPTPAAPSAIPTPAPGIPATASGAEEVTISERIVTAEVLESRLKGARRVRVTARALLTPSAHDVIRTRRLQVIRDSAKTEPGGSAGAHWLLLTVQPVSGLDGAIATWRATGTTVDSKLANDPADAAAIAISAICRGEAANILVLTSAPEWVACLANRNSQVRAAVIADAGAISRLKQTLRPNVLAFDGSRRGSFELGGIFKALDR